MAFITKAEVKRLIQDNPGKHPELIVEELIAGGNQIEGMMARGLDGATGPTGPEGPQGPQGPRGDNGRDGRDGRDGKDGQDGQDGKPGPMGPAGPQGKQGPKGEDGTHTVVHVQGGGGGGGGGLEVIKAGGVVKKQGASQIDFSTGFTVTPTINGVVVTVAAGAGTTLTAEDPTGTIDDTNLTFSVGNTPIYISVNGLIYTVGKGIYASYAGGTITLNSPVGTGGFIISFYNA